MKSIVITLENHSLIIPVNYHHLIQGFIYSCVRDAEEYAALLHDTGFQYADKSYKLFTFGPLKGKSKYKDKKLYFSTDLTLEIRFVDDHMAELVFQHIENNPSVRLGSSQLNVIDMKISEISIFYNEVLIRMESALTVHRTYEGKTYYFEPGESEFRELVIENAQKKYFAAFGRPYQGVIDFSPYQINSSDKVVSSFKGIMITGYKGDYCLSAEKSLLKFLYYSGLGDRNSQGFGMFEII